MLDTAKNIEEINDPKYDYIDEELYLPTDDTVDIGKEPLPVESEEIAKIKKKYKEMDIKKVYSK